MLHIINILPAYQGMGIGQQAIKLVEKIFSDAKSWRLETLEDMVETIICMKKWGISLLVEKKK